MHDIVVCSYRANSVISSDGNSHHRFTTTALFRPSRPNDWRTRPEPSTSALSLAIPRPVSKQISLVDAPCAAALAEGATGTFSSAMHGRYPSRSSSPKTSLHLFKRIVLAYHLQAITLELIMSEKVGRMELLSCCVSSPANLASCSP
ncbi:hypothetical protein HRR83_000233 [Exophiala dermatitidis]|uniref:Uncharacterized protein n=1 Tax=Exophiala dermatitidis TaxID=5970 RepID=A0AAN6F2D9_EXODE|nr:hypothetical protein HRR73_002769 [Exophiala dermatitidis]KAJ4527480.1 hypothetical protein HRR74_000234 [Exophiala dermatitidis]KAJ4531050.1 hypothetical protein HRR76_008731 [Exophiala dermatitidis]KAJ4558217.1 hypothetical protein HRR77_000232 [Exophiala dermatitidis]KAJ4581748.1 hypothetical protein HRR79_000761 [Exophiala dermatitidis]